MGVSYCTYTPESSGVVRYGALLGNAERTEDSVEKLLLRVTEAAELASVSRTTAYELIAAGAWPSVRVGSALRVPLAGLRVWVEAQTRAAGAEVAGAQQDSAA